MTRSTSVTSFSKVYPISKRKSNLCSIFGTKGSAGFHLRIPKLGFFFHGLFLPAFAVNDVAGDSLIGQESDERVQTGLDQVVLEENEQVVFLQTYDFMVCDYIEVIFYTFTPDDITKSHCVLLDRGGNVIGIASYELDFVMTAGQTYTDSLKEIVTYLMDESVYIWDAITYAPGYKISDLNEDGYVDIYYSYSHMFLWDNGEYRLCSREN